MPRPIKRYGNRKLYDVQASAYVSLEDVAALVRAGETVVVTDNATGEDITAQTLTQVLLDEGKRGSSPLPTDLLHAALRRGGRALDHGIDSLRHGVDDLLTGSLGRLSRVFPVPRADELGELRAQVAQLERTVEALLTAQQGRAPRPRVPAADAAATRAAATRAAAGSDDEHTAREGELPAGVARPANTRAERTEP